MSKKIMALVLVALIAVLGFTFVACNGDSEPTTEATEVTEATEATDKDSDLAYIQDKGTLVIGITDYAPMNYKEKGSDEWIGFDTEYAQAVAKELGVEAEFVLIDWDNKFFELDGKAIDLVWNGMTISDDVTNNASVTKAYAENAQVVVMANDKLADYADEASLKDLAVAVENGSAGAEAAEAAGIENVTPVQDQATALMEVASGAADACIIDLTMANAVTGEGTSYEGLGFSIKLSAEEFGIAAREGSDMIAKLDELTAKLIADGTLEALAEKYDVNLVK